MISATNRPSRSQQASYYWAPVLQELGGENTGQQGTSVVVPNHHWCPLLREGEALRLREACWTKWKAHSENSGGNCSIAKGFWGRSGNQSIDSKTPSTNPNFPVSHNLFRGLAREAQTVQMNYPNYVDHVAVLREKIERLRAEIAEIQELNTQYRLQGRNDVEAHFAHGQRHERLQAIQQELAQLAALGRKPQLVKQ